VNKLGQMVQNMLVNGVKTEHMGKESSFTSTGMCMMAFGLTIKQMVQVFTSTLTARCTKVSGKMIFNTAKALRPGQIKADMKASMLLAENMESEAISGTTEASTQVTGVKTRLVVLVSTLGLMVGDTKVSGWKIIWKALEFTYGTMEECIKVNTKTTKSTDMEYTHGQTVVVTKVIGLGASSTV